MKRVIIAVHGLGNKPPPETLRAGWLRAIHEGLARFGKPRETIPFEMVYWADVSHGEPLDPDETDPEAPLYLKEPYAASSTEPAKQPKRVVLALLRFIEQHMDQWFLRKDLKETFPAASAKMMERYFTDLDTYYTDTCQTLDHTDCSAKAAIQGRLSEALEKHAGKEILLIAHSMGSIIAFDTLSNPKQQTAINTLVTMGSPLGLPPIVARNFEAQKQWWPDRKQPAMPDNIWPHWYNLSDPGDHVALDHTLRDDYAPNRHGARALDLRVVNDYAVGGAANPHKSYGYLRATETADIIDAFLSEALDSRLRKTGRRITSNLFAAPRRLWRKIS